MLTWAMVMVAAAAPISADNEAAFLGWSTDGESVAWTEKRVATSTGRSYVRVIDGGTVELKPEEVMKLSAAELATLEITTWGDGQITDSETTVAVIHHVPTGKRREYQLTAKALTPEGRDLVPDAKVVRAEAKAFEQWKGKNLAVLKGDEGPRGAKAALLVNEQRTRRLTDPECEQEARPVAQLSVARGPAMVVQRMPDRCKGTWGAAVHDLELWWEPTGRRVAFVFTSPAFQDFRVYNPQKLEIRVVDIPPRVEVLAPARLTKEAQRLAGLAESLGSPTTLGVATKDRQATVIYASEGHLDTADRLVRAIPGATVEPLTWKANGELVIAVGAPK